LSNNKLVAIEGLEDLPLRELCLTGNNIASLNGLDRLPHLTTLLIADNAITSLAPLAQCSSLTLVDVSRNQLQGIRQVEFLGDIQWLRVLLLHGNPCWKKELYRYCAVCAR
jgi:Leucine-rich repeat (LRR) protein